MAISTLAARSITIDTGGITALVCLDESTLYACLTLIQFYGVQIYSQAVGTLWS